MAEGDVSPNIHFRELDDEFMQKQAKVWLEAVLEERYGETKSLADLLGDGDILFRVSKYLKELIRTSLGGDEAFPCSETTHDGKGGKYLPYSNVDAFLKICKRVGLPDVDLFTPPDVVEKKDIRRVCFCIRALSKKARSQNLQVPDFDKVAHSVPMPTEKVGGIREHLQQAAVASLSPDLKSPKPHSIGRVLSSPSLAGSPFLDTTSNGSSGIPSYRSSPLPTETRIDSISSAEELCNSHLLPDEEAAAEKEATSESGVVDANHPPHSPVDESASSEPEDMLIQPGVVDGDPPHSPVDESASSEPIAPVDADIEDGSQHHPHSPVEESASSEPISPIDADIEQRPVVRETQDKNPKESGLLWLPIALGAVGLVAFSVLASSFRPRQSKAAYYEVKEGDTLSKISRRCERGGWKELAEINPGLANPDLIYPTDRMIHISAVSTHCDLPRAATRLTVPREELSSSSSLSTSSY